MAGIVLNMLLLGYMLWRYKKHTPASKTHVTNLRSYWPVAVLLVPAISLWCYAQQQTGITGDEIFSATFCAGTSLFRTWSYYMLPNNHIFFNLLNNVLSSLLHTDAVITGRAISFLSYVGMLCVAYVWMVRQTGNKWLSVVMTLPLALQLSTFLLAQEGRGYELQLFFAWGAFAALFSYVLSAGKASLRWFVIASMAGFACVPTYLYIFFSQMLFIACIQLYNRKVDIQLCLHAGIVIAGTYLFYLPALCFSGVDAFVHNEYVQSGNKDYTAFLPDFYVSLKMYVNAITSSLIEQDHYIHLVLFLLPVLLLFSHKKADRLISLFYILLWLGWGVLIFKMQRMPFIRNMVLHYSFSLAIIVYTFYTMVSAVVARIRQSALRNWLVAGVVTVPVILLCINQYNWCVLPRNFSEEVTTNQHVRTELAAIGKSSTIAVSEWSVFYYYFGNKDGYKVTLCPSGTEDYYIHYKDEPMPANMASRFTLLKHTAEGYDVYKRNGM